MNSKVSTASASMAAFWLGVRSGGGFIVDVDVDDEGGGGGVAGMWMGWAAG